MAGHSKWAQIKHQKTAADQKRGQLFSKLLRIIGNAAKEEADPKFNPTLRAAIERAREYSVPQENIDRAIGYSVGMRARGEELLLEAYDQSGAALLIKVITNNKKQTLTEVKKILIDHQAKLAEAGAVRWVFEYNPNLLKSADQIDKGSTWRPKFFHTISQDQKTTLEDLIKDLKNRGDVQSVFTNDTLSSW